MTIYGILAVSSNHVIGKNNKLPWHLPNDLRWFKMNTYKKIVVMGYNTWCSLPTKPLPGRRNIVMTSKYIEGVETCSRLSDLFVRYGTCDLYIIGGATLLTSLQDVIDVWVVTHVEVCIRGDCHFVLPYKLFKTVYESKTFQDPTLKFTYRHAIYTYKARLKTL